DHLLVMQIELRLAGKEVMQIVLAAARGPRPGAATENPEPVVRRRSIGSRIGPDIPVGLFTRARPAAVGKPVVFVGCVTPDLIDHDLEAEGAGAPDQAVEA